jgi:hypothetical protein
MQKGGARLAQGRHSDVLSVRNDDEGKGGMKQCITLAEIDHRSRHKCRVINMKSEMY